MNAKEKKRKNAQTTISSYILKTPNNNRKTKKFIKAKIKSSFNNYYYSKSYTNSLKQYNNNGYTFTTTTLYDKNYDILLDKYLPYNSKLDKEIINMTGIYNTKREIKKKRLIISSKVSPKNINKNKRLAKSNYIDRRIHNLTLLTNKKLAERINLRREIN
jgi:hypothetical protein